MGALFTQHIVQCRWAEFIGWLRGGPGALIGTSLNTDLDYQQPHYAAPTFLLIGNEARACRQTMRRRATRWSRSRCSARRTASTRRLRPP
jgi:tRNA G18 (ribose-2'-O)-methylase SpoU